MKPKYKKMLKRMEEKEKRSSPRTIESWHLYILECRDGSFYTGVTKDISNRFLQHQNGKASRYTRTRLPVKLVYQETGMTHTEALVRESVVKTLSRKAKEKLIQRGNTFDQGKESF